MDKTINAAKVYGSNKKVTLKTEADKINFDLSKAEKNAPVLVIELKFDEEVEMEQKKKH